MPTALDIALLRLRKRLMGPEKTGEVQVRDSGRSYVAKGEIVMLFLYTVGFRCLEQLEEQPKSAFGSR